MDTWSGLAHTCDELGRLPQSFDNMAELLEKRDLESHQAEQDLKRSPNDLDQGGRQRPAGLQQTGAEPHLEIGGHLGGQEIPLGSEELFRSLVENIDLGIALINSDYRIIMSNPAQGAHFRKHMSEIIGKECFREFEKREAVCPHCPGTIAMATGKKAEAETQGRRDDGSKFTVRIQAFPRFGPDGQTSGFIEVVEDITQKKQVEKALEMERLIPRNILEATLAGYWDWDLLNDREYLSPTFKKMFGYEDHELPNSPETWQRLIFPEDLPGVLEVFKQHVESRGAVPYYNEVRYRHKDGSTIWVICAGRVIEWDAAGQPRRMVGCHVDITERKRAEEALRQSEEKFRLLYDDAPLGYQSLDKDGRIIEVNQAWLDILGYAREEVIGRWIGDFLSPEFVDHFRKQFPYFKEIGEIRDIPFKMVRRDGTIIWGSFNGKIAYDAQGRFLRTHCMFQDITARQRVENIMAARLRLLEFANSHSADELLTATLDEIEALTGSTISFYHFIEVDQHTLLLQNWSTHTLQNMCTAKGKGSHYDINQAGVWVDCVYQRRPVIHNDYASLPHRKGMPAGHAPVVREVVVPIFRGKLIKAIIGVGNKSTNYTDNDIEIVSQLGDLSWDIVERKRAETSLADQFRFLQVLIDTIPTPIFYKDVNGVYLGCNQSLAEFLGRPKEEIIGKTVFDIYPQDQAEKFHQMDQELFHHPGTQIYDFIMGRSDGILRDFIFTKATFVDLSGRVAGLIGVMTDITERKRAEAALRDSEMRYRAIVDAFDGFIYICSQDYRVEFMNDKFISRTGYDATGELCYQALHGRDSICPWCVNERVFKGETVRWEVKSPKDDRWFYIVNVPIYHSDGTMSKQSMIQDITERKRTEETIKLNEARLAGLLRISQYQAESIQDLLNYALEEAIALTASKMGFIYLYDDTSQQLTLNTWSSGLQWECTISDPQTIFQLEDIGIWGEAVRQGRPMVVNDFLASHPLQEGNPADQAPHKFLTIPVFANKRIVAVVGVANKAADYEEADVLQLTLMMDAVWKIVERRQAEEELQAAAYKWQTTFDAITDAVFLLDPDGIILQCNRALADLVQKPFADILGRPCCEVVHGTYKFIPGCPMERMRQTRQREIMLLPWGSRWFNLGVDPILGEAGNLVGAVHIMSDVTQLMEAERSLYRRTQDLTMMNTIGSIMSRSLDLSKVLGGSLRMIQENMFDGKSRIIIFLLDEATGELRAAGQRGFPEDHPCLGRPLLAGKCLCGRAALSGKIVFSWRGCADCASGFPALDTAPRQDIGLPLKVRDHLLGVMHMSISLDQKVDERHLKLLEAIADQISVAVEKARLFEQVNLQGTQLRTLSARLAELEEAERKAMARELHDHVGQSLTTLSLYLTMLQEQLPRMVPEKAQSRLTDALTLVEETADSVREIMAELRPPVLDDFGLMAAARWFGKQFSQRTGIRLQATGEDPEPRLDRKVEMGLFRILQEALNNVAKHARASQVTVTEEVLDDRVRFTIADDGIGFDVSQVGRPEGRHRWGLMNMSERALAAGGTCRIDSQPGQGTRVIVEVNR